MKIGRFCCSQTTLTIHAMSNVAQDVDFTLNGTPYNASLDPATDHGTAVFTITGLAPGTQFGAVDLVFSVDGTFTLYPYTLSNGNVKVAWTSCNENYNIAIACNELAETDAELVVWIGDIYYGDNWIGQNYLNQIFSELIRSRYPRPGDANPTATSGTTTSMTDSAADWEPNAWYRSGWANGARARIYNITQGADAAITGSSGGTTIDHDTMPAWNPGDEYQIHAGPIKPQLTYANNQIAVGFTDENFIDGILQSLSRPYVSKMLQHKAVAFMPDDHETGIGDEDGYHVTYNSEQGSPLYNSRTIVATTDPQMSIDIAALRDVSFGAYWDMLGSGNGFGDRNNFYGYIDIDYARLHFIDCMTFKSPWSDGKAVTDASRVFLGASQEASLKANILQKPLNSLFSSKKPFPSRIDSQDGYVSYQYERDLKDGAIMPYITENGRGVNWPTGDRHNWAVYSARVGVANGHRDPDDPQYDKYPAATIDHASYNSSSMDYANHALGIGYATHEVEKVTWTNSQRTDALTADPPYWSQGTYGVMEYQDDRAIIDIIAVGQGTQLLRPYTQLAEENFVATTTTRGYEYVAQSLGTPVAINQDDGTSFPVTGANNGVWTTDVEGIITLGAWSAKLYTTAGGNVGAAYMVLYEWDGAAAGDALAWSNEVTGIITGSGSGDGQVYNTFNTWTYRDTDRVPNNTQVIMVVVQTNVNPLLAESEATFTSNVIRRLNNVGVAPPANNPSPIDTPGWQQFLWGDEINTPAGGSRSMKNIKQAQQTFQTPNYKNRSAQGNQRGGGAKHRSPLVRPKA